MDLSIMKMLASTFGGAGIAIGAAYMMFKSLMTQVDKKDASYLDRIKALEATVSKQVETNQSLHTHIHTLEEDLVKKTIEVISRNSEIIRRVENKLQQEE